MAKLHLQREIISEGGLVLSSDTLRPSDLLQRAAEVINAFYLEPDFMEDLETLLERSEEELNCGPWRAAAEELFNESLFYYFNEIAPMGFYFGACEGDGALIGWFWEDQEL